LRAHFHDAEALEARDAEVERYKEELQAIIGELMALKGE